MHAGAITSYIDVAQLTLYAFWIFFAGLIWYLRLEDRREGYPLQSERTGKPVTAGFPWMPKPKVFLLSDGSTQTAPRTEAAEGPFNAVRTGPWLGAPLHPTGNPLLSGVGPASFANRHDVPDLTAEGHVKIVPLRVASDFWIDGEDPDPRGFKVIGADGAVAGKVLDLWVDRAEVIARYLEVEVAGPSGPRAVLVPVPLTRIDAKAGAVKVASILGSQFGEVPATKHADQVTFREEDQISAYYGGGKLYAKPSRLGPVL